MDIEKIAENFGKFLGHYSGELRTIAATIQTIVDNMPIDAQDKERLSAVLTSLQDAATSVANAAGSILNGDGSVEVVVDKADVEAAVSNYMEQHPTAGAAPEGN